jgi:hypothetical protein
MQQTTHCTGVMHTAMIQQELKAGCCQNSVEYWKMYRHVCTMYIHISKFLSMYIKWTGITYLYRHVCTITFLYIHGINMYIPCTYRFYIPVQVQTCLYMVQTCLYRFAKSCPGGQDSRCSHAIVYRRLATSASPTRDIFSTEFSLKRDSAGRKCVYSVT